MRVIHHHKWKRYRLKFDDEAKSHSCLKRNCCKSENDCIQNVTSHVALSTKCFNNENSKSHHTGFPLISWKLTNNSIKHKKCLHHISGHDLFAFEMISWKFSFLRRISEGLKSFPFCARFKNSIANNSARAYSHQVMLRDNGSLSCSYHTFPRIYFPVVVFWNEVVKLQP